MKKAVSYTHLRIVKYDRNWNRVGAASITGGESYTCLLYTSFAWFRPRSLLSLCCPEPAAIHRATLLVTTSEGTVRQAELTDGGQGEALLEQMAAAEVVPAGRYQNIPVQSVLYRVMLSTVDGEMCIRDRGSCGGCPPGLPCRRSW